jgi:tetratricopeptide (TPR) repeat protein
MLKNPLTNQLPIKFCIVFLSLVFFIACTTATDEASLQNDAEAKQTIAKVSQVLGSGQKPSTEDLEKIKGVYEKYPTSETARKTYQKALIKYDDLGALEQLLTEGDLSKLTDDEKKTLARVYLRLGKFRQALDLLKPLSEANPNDVELKSLIGLSYFNSGEMEEAGKTFDSIWDELLKNKNVEEISMRGIIYFHQNNLPKAIETLEKALEIDPNHIPSNNALSRVYAKKGDSEKAEEYRNKTAKAQEVIQNETFAKSKQVSKIYELEEAWKNKKYQEVINLSKEMLADAADKNQKAILYQYLYQSYQALGMKTEAQDVIKEAQQLNQK